MAPPIRDFDEVADVVGTLERELADVRARWSAFQLDATVKIAVFRAEEIRLLALLEQARRHLQGSATMPPGDSMALQIVKADGKRSTKAKATKAKRRPGRPSEVVHPLVKAGVTDNLSEFARDHGISWDRLRSWGDPGSKGRQIPEVWAKHWLKKYEIPLRVWPKGVRASR